MANSIGSRTPLSFAQVCATKPTAPVKAAAPANTTLHTRPQLNLSAKTNWGELPDKSAKIIKKLISGAYQWNDKNKTIFYNRELLLPSKPQKDYYRKISPYPVEDGEYGGHRIVLGGTGNAMHTIHYTKDHYLTFIQIWRANGPTSQTKPHNQPTTPTKPQ